MAGKRKAPELLTIEELRLLNEIRVNMNCTEVYLIAGVNTITLYVCDEGEHYNSDHKLNEDMSVEQIEDLIKGLQLSVKISRILNQKEMGYQAEATVNADGITFLDDVERRDLRGMAKECGMTEKETQAHTARDLNEYILTNLHNAFEEQVTVQVLLDRVQKARGA